MIPDHTQLSFKSEIQPMKNTKSENSSVISEWLVFDSQFVVTAGTRIINGLHWNLSIGQRVRNRARIKWISS